jgi:hypothetical protein
MKKILPLLLLIAVCLFACKKEPDLPDDPHVSLVNNPFTGVWNLGGEYWRFRLDGTGGRAAKEAGPFPDNFSFFIYAGQDVQTAPSEGTLVLLDDSGSTDIAVTRYKFSINNNQAVLTVLTYNQTIWDFQEGASLTLQRVSGAPSAIIMTNPLIGEWSAQWTGSHGDNTTWSLKYRSDGTVKLYHHGLHQFENGYALRGNILVIFGLWRFEFEPVIAKIQAIENGKWQVNETQAYPPPANWTYTKVTAADWL